MNVEALEKLVELLHVAPRESFDLRNWKCGSVCCAVGLAASDPWFNERGLKLGATSKGSDRFWPVYDDGSEELSSFLAVEKFFGLNSDQSYHLFSPEYYDDDEIHNPLAVAERIQRLIDSHQQLEPAA